MLPERHQSANLQQRFAKYYLFNLLRQRYVRFDRAQLVFIEPSKVSHNNNRQYKYYNKIATKKQKTSHNHEYCL